MMIVYGVLFALCANLAYSRPRIVHITPNQIIDIDSTVELRCTVSDTMNLPVIWIKHDFEKSTVPRLISATSGIIVKDFRFSMKKEELNISSKYTLQIQKIKETDAGLYRCQVLSDMFMVFAEVELHVRVPPIIYKNSTSSMIVMEGQPLILECYAHGIPTPKIYWKRENNGILHVNKSIYSGSIWKIPVVTKDDRGTYSCIAENGIGKGNRHRIAIQVEYAPHITVPKYRKGQAMRYDTNLECHIESYPSPAIIWTHHGVQLSNNEHYMISQIASTDDFTNSILSISKIEYRMYGEYNCKAFNKLGNVEVTIHLYETTNPVNSSITGIQTY